MDAVAGGENFSRRIVHDRRGRIRRNSRRTEWTDVPQIARRASNEYWNAMPPEFSDSDAQIAFILIDAATVRLAEERNALVANDTLHSRRVGFDLFRAASAANLPQ